MRPETSLPQDRSAAVLVGRAWVPGSGPTLIGIRGGDVHDLSAVAATCSQLLELDDPAGAVKSARGTSRLAPLEDVLANSLPEPA